MDLACVDEIQSMIFTLLRSRPRGDGLASSPHHVLRSCAAWRWWCKPLFLLAASTLPFALMEQGLGLESGLGTAFG